MNTLYCLDVSGDYACFTRPEMKVERVSYEVITPSATRAIFEAIFWKPQIRWVVTKIEVLNPIRWATIRRNEVGGIVPTNSVGAAMKKGSGNLGLYVEEDRQQRASLLLKNVRYRLHAQLELVNRSENIFKYAEMFSRRAEKGQCFNQPYFGCREFPAYFTLLESPDPISSLEPDRDLGWMLYDLDYAAPQGPAPLLFRAMLQNGAINVPHPSSEEIRR